MDPIAFIAGGTSLAGYVGQQETNRSNETIANNATAANMAEAQRNREFQAQQISAQRDYETQMSNTSHQRAVEDLKKAGLNPILAVNGGASTPTSGAASGAQGSANTATMQNPAAHLSGIVSSALDALNSIGALKKQEAETNLIKSQTSKTDVDREVAKKGIPGSELVNEGYSVLKPLIRKLKDATSASAKQFEKSPTVRGFDPKTKTFRITP